MTEVTPTQAELELAEEWRTTFEGDADWLSDPVIELAKDIAAHRLAHEVPLLARNAALETSLAWICRPIGNPPECGDKGWTPDKTAEFWKTVAVDARKEALAALAPTKDTPERLANRMGLTFKDETDAAQ